MVRSGLKKLLKIYFQIIFKNGCGNKKQLYICSRLGKNRQKKEYFLGLKIRKKNVHWDIEIDSVGSYIYVVIYIEKLN